MKNKGQQIIFLVVLTIMTLSTSVLKAQTEVVTIKSSMICEMCEETIKEEINFEKGVKLVTTDLKNNQVIVKYNSKKTTADEIRLALSKVGYDADEVKKDMKAFKKLPHCCQDANACSSHGAHDGHDHGSHEH